jgi:large subunit ribosomal protein L4
VSITTYTKSGNKATTAAKLDENVFGVAITNHDLLKQAYVAYLANGRQNLARTKTRGLVSGGGKKPWRQKGTGRARFGSSRNPIWRGGGIAFGPTGNENYGHKLTTTTKRQAVRQALTLASASDKLMVIESFDFKDGKTAGAAKLLGKIGAVKNSLLIVENKTPELIRATNNLSNVKLVQARYINVYDALNADHIIITRDALEAVNDWLNPSKNASSTGDKK